MNPAQKRAWYELIISIAGLAFTGISYYFFNQLGDPPYAAPWIYIIPLINLPSVLCLIGYVLTAAKFKTKSFDEREIMLSRKSMHYGFIGIFVFLVAVALIFLFRNIMVTISIRVVLLLILSSFFFSVAVTSVSFLVMYQSKIERSSS